MTSWYDGIPEPRDKNGCLVPLDTKELVFDGKVFEVGGLAYRNVGCAWVADLVGFASKVPVNSCSLPDSWERLEGDAPASGVYSPTHYTSGAVETIRKIEAVVYGLPADAGYLLGNVVKYVDRAGKKGDLAADLRKANNYAHRLVTGSWRDCDE